MKYLVVTLAEGAHPGSEAQLQESFEGMMPGVKLIVIVGASSAILVETDDVPLIDNRIGPNFGKPKLQP